MGYLGIDFGGTKTGVGLIDEGGNELDYEASFNPKTLDAEEVWDSVGQTIATIFKRHEDEIVACGLAAAGPVTNNQELITPPNTLAWKNFPLKSRVEELVGKKVYFEGDAKALALAEGFIGAAKGYKNYLSMVVSTGIGGGIVVDGNLLHGANFNAGEIGHMIINVDGPRDGFGCYGCAESYASGPSLEKKFGISPVDATQEMIEYCANYVAQLIVNLVTVLDLEIVTVGGSVALGFGDPFFELCQQRFDGLKKLPTIGDVKIVPSELGKHGGVIGAARVAMLGYTAESGTV